jgi:hypothetical protein
MKTLVRIVSPALIAAGLLFAVPVSQATEDSLITSVFASKAKGYVREKLPDGSFKPETYVVGNGGYVSGGATDKSLEKVPFPSLVRLLAGHLAKSNYFPTRDSQNADLLLVVYWGTTLPFNDAAHRANTDSFYSAVNLAHQTKLTAAAASSMTVEGTQTPTAAAASAARDDLEQELYQMTMFEGMRQKADEYNAVLLGYMKDINQHDNPSRYAGEGSYFDDLMSDIEEERYYIIVTAFDYKTALHEKKKKIVWSARVSVQAHGNQFDECVSAMVAKASRYFGQNSGRLVRQYQEGVVGKGELKFLGVVPDLAPPPTEKTESGK